MSDVTVSYKGADIATMDASGTKTLQTQGKYCEGDISIAYVKPSGGGGSGFEDISADFDLSASSFIALYNETEGKVVLSGMVEDVYDDVTISYFGGDELVQNLLADPAFALFVCDGEGNGSTVYFASDGTVTFHAPSGQTYFGFYSYQP